jgi:hydroxymethylpyrimidine pyrophosphatase-like HAD family hydrolase
VTDPGWRPKLVVLDLDGTVVPYAEELVVPSPRVRAAVGRVLGAGIPVSIATGRAVWGALPTAADLGLDGIRLVCSNGALVYDAGAGEVLHSVVMDPGPAAGALAAVAPDAAFAIEHDQAGFLVTEGFGLDGLGLVAGIAGLAELTAHPTTRLVCRLPALRGAASWRAYDGASARAAAVASEALDPAAYGWHIGFSAWIDVNAVGVSKATGAAMVAADHEVDPEDVLAVGDGTNDLELFDWAGYSVAMGQSPAVVQAAADEVTAPVEADGVALVLERWF